jgi:hypothetical protein
MGRESVYWLIVLVTFFYIVFKSKKDTVNGLIILCFYSGLAAFYGKGIENPYKIAVVLLSLYILQKDNALSYLDGRKSFLLLMFILFSVSFLYSAIINQNYFTLIFSQYGKYVTPICIFFIFSHQIIKRPRDFVNAKNLIISLINIQILLSVLKIFIIGLRESTIGSIAYMGGGQAVMLPVLAFILIWISKRGVFNNKDWVYVFMLMFIAFASLKRAIWFIMPAVILLFMYYVHGKFNIKKVLFILPIVILVFYLGVRLNPTLNKENKIGGSFDLSYVLEYTQNYNFGITSETREVQAGTGRGGATFLLWEKLTSGHTLTGSDIWGSGLEDVYTTDYEQFDEKNLGLNSKGAITGIFQSYLTSGFIGIILSLLLILSIALLIKEFRIRIALTILMYWDYLFYSGLILRSQILFILLFLIICYSNFKFDQKSLIKRSIINSDDTNRNLQTRTA